MYILIYEMEIKLIIKQMLPFKCPQFSVSKSWDILITFSITLNKLVAIPEFLYRCPSAAELYLPIAHYMGTGANHFLQFSDTQETLIM